MNVLVEKLNDGNTQMAVITMDHQLSPAVAGMQQGDAEAHVAMKRRRPSTAAPLPFQLPSPINRQHNALPASTSGQMAQSTKWQ
jgi:hypothetical protein